MADREPDQVLGTSHFRVLIGRRELGFSEVSRVTSSTDLALPPDQRPHRFETVLLRRALTASTELYEWRRAIVDGKDDRRTVTIHQLDAPGGKIVNSWRLVRAWPSRWSGPSFNALESGVAFEELELAFDDVAWTNPATPTTTPEGG
jgi:T4-like virus tail tube protein gp19